MNQSGGKGGTGQATCTPPLSTCQTLTGNVCVNLTNDRTNCGTCGTACANTQICSNSQCACTGGTKACGAACVNAASDPMNCGDCGVVCGGATPFCSQGACSATCAQGTMACGNSCADLFNDPLNCGSCLNACSGGQSCVQGACGCPPGQSTCNGLCVDLKADTTNCGTCGTRCVVGQVCSNGSCTVSGAGGGGGAGGSSGGSDPSGGTSGGGTSGGGAGGTDVVVPPERMGCAITPGLISDFEEGAAEPVLLKHESRTGEWEMYNDGSSTSQTLTVEASGGTEMCDKFALHVKGSGYGTWGAGFGFSLVDPPEAPKPYNATLNNFTGIRFKAKLGTTADMNSPVRMNISTPWTESAENPGGMCSPSAATTTKAAMDCYQHAGRFLPMGAGEGQLSTTFQTFTYCFDRDLYPLSLPSNLTAEQRNNIGTNILKVQFQFNSGKDYRGSYPANGEYPEFAKALPFDFWIDDVEFISGACPNMPASPSNGSPAKPFPQNTNIGSCAPATNAANFSGALIQAYQHWTKTFVMNDRIVAPEQQNAVTSEAMGYGMMIAAAMGDKAAFDKFWGYVQTRLSGGLMIWKEGQSGSATDGDIDIAYALLMGHAQWPSGGYKSAADSMAAALLNQSTGDVASNVLRGGNTFRNSNFNPSYFIPAALAKFSGASTVLSTNYGFVNTNVTSGTSGIPTDWGNPNDGKASGPGSAQVTSDITDGENGAMGYDAARVPWRLGQHACQDSTANKTALMAIVSLFAQKYDNGATIDLMKAGWLKTNGNPHTNAKDSQGSFIGPMGVAGMAAGNTAMRDRAFRTMLDILENGDFNHTYFPSTVGLITALIMSGNFPVP